MLEVWSILKHDEQMWKTGERMNLEEKMRKNKNRKVIQDKHRDELRGILSRVLNEFTDQFEREVGSMVKGVHTPLEIWGEEYQEKRKLRTDMSVGEKRKKRDQEEQLEGRGKEETKGGKTEEKTRQKRNPEQGHKQEERSPCRRAAGTSVGHGA